jgi:CRISPR-associated protein Cas2
MMMLITYDVDMTDNFGAKRLRKVAKICENFGIRVQNSVFELLIDPAQLITIKAQLRSVIDMQKDSVRFYRLGNNYKGKIDSIGKSLRIQQGETLIL